MNHKIPNDLENWVSEKALAAFKKRIPDIEELETYLRKWKMSLCMENAVVKNIGVRPHEIHTAVKDSFKKMLADGVYKADLFSDL